MMVLLLKLNSSFRIEKPVVISLNFLFEVSLNTRLKVPFFLALRVSKVNLIVAINSKIMCSYIVSNALKNVQGIHKLLRNNHHFQVRNQLVLQLCLLIKRKGGITKNPVNTVCYWVCFCYSSWARTKDPLINSQML